MSVGLGGPVRLEQPLELRKLDRRRARDREENTLEELELGARGPRSPRCGAEGHALCRDSRNASFGHIGRELGMNVGREQLHQQIHPVGLLGDVAVHIEGVAARKHEIERSVRGGPPDIVPDVIRDLANRLVRAVVCDDEGGEERCEDGLRSLSSCLDTGKDLEDGQEPGGDRSAKVAAIPLLAVALTCVVLTS